MMTTLDPLRTAIRTIEAEIARDQLAMSKLDILDPIRIAISNRGMGLHYALGVLEACAR